MFRQVPFLLCKFLYPNVLFLLHLGDKSLNLYLYKLIPVLHFRFSAILFEKSLSHYLQIPFAQELLRFHFVYSYPFHNLLQQEYNRYEHAELLVHLHGNKLLLFQDLHSYNPMYLHIFA